MPKPDAEPEVLEAGQGKWLVSRVSILTEQKEALKNILQNTKQKVQKQLRRLRKVEKEIRLQHSQEKVQQRKLHAEQRSIKQRLRRQVAQLTPPLPPLDPTAPPESTVKIESSTTNDRLESLKETEMKYIIKREMAVKEELED